MTRPVAFRIAMALAVAILGFGAVALAASHEPSWKSHEVSPLARTEVAAGKAGGFIWIAGGFGTAASPSTEVERYDPRSGDWELVTPLPVTLNHSGVFGYRGKPYVFGGFTDVPLAGVGTTSPRLFRFDGAGDGWTELEPAPVGRAAFAIGRIRHRVYVAGGAAGTEQKSARMDIYNIRRDRWRTGSPMGISREHLAGAVAKGKSSRRHFYAIGGRDFYGSANYKTTERFNPRTGRWSTLADTTTGHGGFGAAGIGDRVVALGGEAPGTSPNGTIDTAEVYAPRRDRWRPLPDMITPRHGLAVAAMRGRVYAIEGGTVTLVGISNAVESIRLRP
jgi:hypothetical protein